MLRGIKAEIDLDAAVHNLNAVRETANGLPVIAVVKADAYGHGAAEVAGAFEKAGASALAVAFVSEGAALRESGLKSPIVVLFDTSDIGGLFDFGLTPVVHDLKTAAAFSAEARKRGKVLDVHIKVDTGMGRLGLSGINDVLEAMGLPNLRAVGLMSHFSDADLTDMEFMKLQLDRFNSIREALKGKGLCPPLCHMANSAAVVTFRDSHLDAVRPGLMLYGCLPFKEGAEAALRPVMRAKAEILVLRKLKKGQPVSYARTFITTRETVAAVVAVGYADGYPRALSNRGRMIINGSPAPIMGRICMDLTVVDATDAVGVDAGDEAVLLGEGITAWEMAEAAGTIPYEILTGLGGKARRVCA